MRPERSEPAPGSGGSAKRPSPSVFTSDNCCLQSVEHSSTRMPAKCIDSYSIIPESSEALTRGALRGGAFEFQASQNHPRPIKSHKHPGMGSPLAMLLSARATHAMLSNTCRSVVLRARQISQKMTPNGSTKTAIATHFQGRTAYGATATHAPHTHTAMIVQSLCRREGIILNQHPPRSGHRQPKSQPRRLRLPERRFKLG